MRLILKKTFLQVCWALGLFHITRKLQKDKLQILCYHGFEIEDESSFRPQLFIKKTTFANRLKFIARNNFNVLSLSDALQKLSENKLPQNAVVITIDDGFYSTLDIAADLLNAFQYTATLYLTTYYVKNEAPIFRLTIQYMFWKTVKQEINLSECAWNKDKQMTVDLNNEKNRNHVIWECINYGEKNCKEPERAAICQQLGRLLEVDYKKICDSKILSLLTIDEAKQLASNNINLQLHTHRHTFPTNDEFTAIKEIDDNREILRGIIDYPASHFCYPSGIWSQKQWHWLAQMNVQSATTCEPGLNDINTPIYGLRRFLDGENISEIEFKAELYGFMELLRNIKKIFPVFFRKKYQ